jgi:hypothetical protein
VGLPAREVAKRWLIESDNAVSVDGERRSQIGGQLEPANDHPETDLICARRGYAGFVGEGQAVDARDRPRRCSSALSEVMAEFVNARRRS